MSFIDKQFKLYKAKNALYGNSFVESLDKYGDIAYAVRANDKLNRIKQLSSGKDFTDCEEIVNDEKINDTVGDLFNYTAMLDHYTGTHKDVLHSMISLINNKELLKTYLFSKYGKAFLLDKFKKDEVELFEKFYTILKQLDKDFACNN